MLSFSKPRCILMLALVVGGAAAFIGLRAPDVLSASESEFIVDGSESARALRLLLRADHIRALPEIAILMPARSPADERIFVTVQKVARLVPWPLYSRDRATVGLLGYFQPGVPPGPTAIAIARDLRGMKDVLVGGSALAGQEVRERVKHDLLVDELAACPLVVFVMLVVFGNACAAMLPVACGALAVALALCILRFLTEIIPISVLALNLVIGTVVGLTLDYSLLYISRYREELGKRDEPAWASRAAARTAGRTVAISAGTVACAFASLLVFPLGFLRSIAIGGILAAALAGLTSRAILPAACVSFSRWISTKPPQGLTRGRVRGDISRGLWYRISQMVMRHPVAIATASATVLIGLGIPVVGMHLTGASATSLPPNAEARQFEERVVHGFTHPYMNEVIVAAHGSEKVIRHTVLPRMERLPDVSAGAAKQIGQNLWQFNVVPVGAPYSRQTERLVRKIRALPYHLQVAGSTASYLDTVSALTGKLPGAIMLLVTATMLCLFLATGSVILPAKAIVMNFLTIGACLGVVVVAFRSGTGDISPTAALVVTQPILIAVGAFGVLTDFGVILLTRIREEWQAGLSNREAVAVGLQRTGGVFTGAALVFCIAIGALARSSLTFVQEAALGVSVAVALDAFLVRALLVPSLMIILGRWNWVGPRYRRADRS